jgi:hypothetical protein
MGEHFLNSIPTPISIDGFKKRGVLGNICKW